MLQTNTHLHLQMRSFDRCLCLMSFHPIEFIITFIISANHKRFQIGALHRIQNIQITTECLTSADVRILKRTPRHTNATKLNTSPTISTYIKLLFFNVNFFDKFNLFSGSQHNTSAIDAMQLTNNAINIDGYCCALGEI